MKLVDKIKRIKKSKRKLVCLTAYSKPIAKILDKYCDIVLVGDSVATAFYGMKSTREIKLDTMITHSISVKKALTKSILVLDWLDWWGRGGTIKYRGISFLEKIFEPIETFFEENFRKYAHGNITISVPLKNRAIGLGVFPEAITTIPFGANCEKIKPLDKNFCRNKHGINKNEKTPRSVQILG